MTKSGAEKIRPVQVSGWDWKYMSMVAAPPMDSPKRKAGRRRYNSLRRTWRKKESEASSDQCSRRKAFNSGATASSSDRAILSATA
ncbi:hypothetical protein PRUPE_2G057400 [Prunus persica]|uniref:Uncharacterized protein n=1 Tax=Prunus persica TaxID=3760 RepID=A0A251QBU7_PRUPE|nr:hypothetical protein PRUPE_2G057400 [Prunus persica]